MSGKRVTLLSINTLTTLSKVRNSRNSLDFNKFIAFANNLSTATERSYFQTPDGFNGENHLEYQQNPSGFYAEQQNHIESEKKPNGHGQDWGYRKNSMNSQQNPDGFYGGHSTGLRQNASGVHGHNLRNELQQNPVGQSGNFSKQNPRNESQQKPIGENGNYYTNDQQTPNGLSGGNLQPHPYGSNREGQEKIQQNANGFYGGNSTGLRQNASGVHWQNLRNESQQNPVGQSGNFSKQNARNEFQQKPIGENGNYYTSDQQNPIEKSSNINGYYGTRPVQQTPNGLSGGNLQPHPYGSNREGQEKIQQNANGFYGQSISKFQGTINEHYGQSTGQFQHNPSNYYGHSTGVPQQYPSNYYTCNTGAAQQNPGNYYMGYPEKTQQMPSNYHTGNTEAQHYQQSSCGFNGVMRSPDGFSRENVGEYQQNPIGNFNANAGQYQQNSYDSQNGVVGPHLSSKSKPNGESAEATESGQYIRTIEELDGFSKEGKVKEAVELLKLLEKQHIPVDLPRYLTLMKACGEAKALQEAKFIHEHLMRSVSPLQVHTCNKIVEMYAECGSMDDAYMVFQKMQQRNLTSWDTMITWLVRHGQGEDAIDLFTQFKETGLKPDGQIFIAVFSACSALGDINEGMLHFESMSKNYGIVPSMEHYASVVDMLGSTGYLDEAVEFIENMPIEPSVDVWETLMNLSRVHGNIKLGDRCAELVEILDPSRLNKQSKAGLITDKASNLAKEKEKKKLAGKNLLEIRSKIHEYRAGDKSHPDSDKIYALLRGMKGQMKEAGYVPETRFVLHDIDQEGKEEALLAHSERLAVAQGLISSSARSQIRIIKNLRVCGDCHSALKIISKLVGRELIIRDAKRFHHFKDGLCSCRDYW
ncbi:pentatricopeptide repeat-containing protein At4g32450, mitochondrial-like [Cornus florida]|uniref:pentatricopeptide repeat-containing protein At4g32450, mitochondrial-like n=1 Tax=Cornus florida TaxID=4283 RepID=UPI002896B3EB|nr:pentatricopeptide repeat-containing protein At4g32450, mitochondrial-like [Cornus florida]